MHLTVYGLLGVGQGKFKIIIEKNKRSFLTYGYNFPLNI